VLLPLAKNPSPPATSPPAPILIYTCVFARTNGRMPSTCPQRTLLALPPQDRRSGNALPARSKRGGVPKKGGKKDAPTDLQDRYCYPAAIRRTGTANRLNHKVKGTRRRYGGAERRPPIQGGGYRAGPLCSRYGVFGTYSGYSNTTKGTAATVWMSSTR